MPGLDQFFHLESGKPLKVGDQTVTLISKAFRLIPPRGFGGLVWNRPVAVQIDTKNGETIMLPVIDETRRRELIILGSGLAAALLLAMFFRPRRSSS